MHTCHSRTTLAINHAYLVKLASRYEPRHDKTNKMCLRPAKTQISLRIRPVRSEYLLCTQWVAKDQRYLHADSGCPGWSEASLGAHSFCWFCHVTAHIYISLLYGKSITIWMLVGQTTLKYLNIFILFLNSTSFYSKFIKYSKGFVNLIFMLK